jgi:hypothetical protein
MLAAATSALRAAAKPDPNVDPVLPDPQPNGATFPPGIATAGTADPGPALYHLPSTTAMRPRQDCTVLSPCALDSPPLKHLPPPR